MSGKKKGSGLKILLFVLILAMAAVVGIIVWKQWEYSASENFYDSLRGMLTRGRFAA